jgi:acetyl esterase/lipase
MKNRRATRISCFTLMLMTGILLSGCIAHLPNTVKVERNLEYARIDGQSLQLDIYSPKQPVGKLPVVVWIHGGSWNSGSRHFCPIGFMATQNLAIVSMDYRLTGTAIFPAQIYDCKSSVRWLRAHAAQFNLDPDHIGIFGASAGGQLALLLATTPDNAALEGDEGGNRQFSSRVQCVGALYPPTDLSRLVTNADVAKLIGGPVALNPEKARAASPLSYVDKNCAPIFLMHGGADQLVPVEQSQIFYAALLKAGVPAQFEIIPGKGHGIIPPPPVAQEIYRFFAQYLGTKFVPPGP